MAFDFDRVVDRSGGDSFKWNRYAGRDVLPLWVADMDFVVPPAVLDALRRRVSHGVFGYGDPWPSLLESVQGHLAQEYGWSVDPAWIVWLPGIDSGLHVACRAVDGSAFTATPIYPPFLSAARAVVTAPLARREDRWEWDFEAVESALAPDTRLFLLCHPHNPVGRDWDEAELREIAALAERHDLLVCSDEVHCGLVLDPSRRHRPFASLGEAAARHSVTLMAPSKTFNLPGLGCAFAVIPDPRLRGRFRRAMHGIVPHVNVLGLVACEAALRHGADWRHALIEYLRGNRDQVLAAVGAMPGLCATPVEATCLAWIDARGSGIPRPQQFFETAGVGLSEGVDFGPGEQYRGFLRLNFGCPRAILDEALVRMRRALA
jgi:cystathionine beta-lyase